MTELDGSVDVNEGIVRFLWRIRRVVMVTIIMLLLLLWGHLLLDDYRTSLIEYRTAFAVFQEYDNGENGDFSSVNLDRVESGVYQLRVEVAGERIDERREDSPVDFDRDLRLTVSMLNGILLLNVTNERDDVLVEDVEIRGSLVGRELDNFHQISIADIQTNLGYNETSRGVPISVFATDDELQLQLENWRWMTDIREFRENFKLHYIEVSFREMDSSDELIRLRYTTSTDFYEIISRENLNVE